MKQSRATDAQDASPAAHALEGTPVRRRALVAALCATVLVTAACAEVHSEQDETPSPSAAPLRIGVSLAGQHYDVGAVDAWEAAVGHRADVVQTFVPWLYAASPDLVRFPVDRAREISEGGRVLEVTWTPAEPSEGEDQPGISLAAIADGDYDAYVRRFAQDVRRSGLTIRMRFAHEMNGTWSRWSETRPGNGSGDYVRAWRHVHEVFAQEGARSVTWIWSPNVVGSSTSPLPELYPGDAYVDEVAIDGYSYPRASCLSPAALFDPTLAEVRDLTNRPVALGEVGVDVACPGRAAWVTDVYAWSSRNQLVGVTWWEREGATGDFAITDDPAALTAQRAAIRSP